jgi:catechol 2,3-dioxygenase-like lactoylglutathione lyase family enzyme
MTRMTTRIMSVSQQVADQDRALAFYVDVLGCQVRADMELWPGARWVEVVPPGSDVGIALLTAESGLPVGVRLGTEDADAAHAKLTAAGTLPGEEVLRLDFAPPMFTFSDPDNNLLILIEDEDTQDGGQEKGSGESGSTM